MKAVILAGGRGRRFGNLTKEIPKVMLEINEKPILETIIKNIKKAGLRNFIIVVNYKKEKIIEYFGDGSKFGVNIQYAYQEYPKGTGDAVRYVEPFIDEDIFLLIYGDVILDSNTLSKIIKLNKPLICLKEVEDPRRFGVVEIKNGKIFRIVEKSNDPPSNLVNTGIYLLPIEIFDAIKKTSLSKRGEYELTDSIQILIENGKEFDYFLVDETTDIGTKEIYLSLIK